MLVKIWQLYFDNESFAQCGEEYIPKLNTERDYRKNPFAENLTIINIYLNEQWQDADFVGCISWRFKQKTGLNYQQILDQIDSNKIYSLSPKIYNDWPHTFERENIKDERMQAIPGITEIIKFIDAKGILPIQIEGKIFNNSFCNFWMLSPEYFRDYLNNYLIPLYLLMQRSEAKELLKYKTRHGSQEVASFIFFLEGLFSVFLYNKQFKYIQ